MVRWRRLIDLNLPMREATRQRSLVWSTNAFLRRKLPLSVLRRLRGLSTAIGTIPKQSKSLALPFLSRRQRLPISSELLFPIFKEASDSQPCRLIAFGGLRKALNSSGYEM